MLQEILGRKVRIHTYIYRKTVLDIVDIQENTTERRLLIDFCVLRESNSKWEIENIAWIPGERNAADGLKKQSIKQNSP